MINQVVLNNHILPFHKENLHRFYLLTILLNRTTSKAWHNHPAVKMWKGYENALKHYYNIMVEEWIKRGYKNNMLQLEIKGDIVMPSWLGRADIHERYREKLLSKNFKWYSQFGWKEVCKVPNNDPYIWPVKR